MASVFKHEHEAKDQSYQQIVENLASWQFRLKSPSANTIHNVILHDIHSLSRPPCTAEEDGRAARIT